MKFPNVKVQPHWLATLERAVEMLPNVHWVCSALDNGVEPRIEEEVRTAIAISIAPHILVNSWLVSETGASFITRAQAQKYRKAWLNHMIEQCLEMQQALHEEEDEEEDDSEYDCPHCGGTGEGQYDGQTCSVCRGKGVCPK